MSLVDKILSASIKILQKKQKQLRRKRRRKKKAARRRWKMKRKPSTKRKTAKGKKRISKKKRRIVKRKPKKKIKKKRKASPKKVKRKAIKKKVRNRPKRAETPKKQTNEQLIGDITHFFSRIQVVVVKITKDKLDVGDKIHIKGRSTDFTQKVDSLQIESVDVTVVKKGQLAGLKVKKKAKEGDQVFKIV